MEHWYDDGSRYRFDPVFGWIADRIHRLDHDYHQGNKMTLTEQYEDARRAYFRSRDRRPHAAITVRLRDKMQALMLQCLADWHARNRAA